MKPGKSSQPRSSSSDGYFFNEMLILKEYQGNTINVDMDQEIRCPYCKKLIIKGRLGRGTKIELMCSRKTCRRKFRLEVT